MGLARRLARPLLAAIFVGSGLDVLEKPDGRIKIAEPYVHRVAATIPMVPDDPAAVVTANALVHVVAGSALALGIAPRLTSAVLAGTLVPTTLGAHRFWEIEDPAARGQQRTHFLKNAAILGGLIVTALD